MGGVGFSSETVFTIQTTGTPVLPKITIAESGDAMNLDFMGGEPQRSYVFEASRDMVRWLPLEERWMDGGPNSYYDDDARYLGSRFYRLRDRLAEERATKALPVTWGIARRPATRASRSALLSTQMSRSCSG